MQFSLFTPTILRVSELTTHLRHVVEADDLMADVWVQGEISNANRYASGHFYFSLKDENAAMRCVMWKGQVARLPRLPREGEAVNAHGHVSVYDARGEVQLYVDAMELLGAGALWQEFEKLKQKLANEGLFDEGRKRPLPKFPQRIGIVTSKSGAVLQDIRHILERRYPIPQVFLAPTAVQGADAPPQIVAALKRVQQIPNLDVILLARGGGSIEDLWAFNDERVVRAVAASDVPVICGVGHETDFTLCDFAADLRAPTPTAAAELATPITIQDLAATVSNLQSLILTHTLNVISSKQFSLSSLAAQFRYNSPARRIQSESQRVDEFSRRALSALLHSLQLQKKHIEGTQSRLEALSPLAVLGRGYAVVRRKDDGSVVSRVAQASDVMNVRVSDGEFEVRK